MAGIYDERILGAQQQKEFARRLRDQAAEPAGQMVSGWYVPNTGGAVVSALRNMMGAYQENKADEELKGIEREKAQATIQALNKAGIEAPEAYALQAGTPAQQPGFIDKAVSFLRGNEQPQATPAIPYQQNVAQNVNPNAMLNLAITNPDMASSALAVQKLKHEQLKEAEQERVKGVPTGFTLNQAGQLVPMPLAGGGNYADWSMDKALAGQRYISPVETQNMGVQLENLALNKKASQRAEDKAASEKAAAENPQLNQVQSENLNFGNAMKNAHNILSEIGTKYDPQKLENFRIIENMPWVSSQANAELSANEQNVNQAQKMFVNAINRKESGATVTPAELRDARQRYFPAPNDKPETLAQKTKAREEAIRGIFAGVPEKALKRFESTPEQTGYGKPPAGAVVQIRE